MMKQTYFLQKLLQPFNITPKSYFLITICIIITACDKEDEVTAPDPLTFQQVIETGGNPFESIPETRTTEVLSESAPINEDYTKEEDGVEVTERSLCVTKKVSVLDGNPEFLLFDANSTVIYPGNLLQGATLSEATPKPIVVERAGGTISYNLNNGNLLSTFTVDEVSKSSIQNAMNNIIAGAGDVVPANFQVDIVQVESESQMALEMGIKTETFNTKVKADMSFSTEKQYNRTLVKVSQAYYTMNFDLPTSLDKIFGENVTAEELQTYIQPDNPATFISSVTYGRIFYMLIESTSSRQEMESSLNIAYDAVATSATGTVNISAFDALKEVKIKVIAYGGDAEGAFQLLGETSIGAIAEQIGASTDIKAGLPLSYEVRSVERPDQVVGTKLATEYDIVTCEVKGILPPEAYLLLVDVFEDGIGAAFQVRDKLIVLYNKAGDQYAYYNVGGGEAPRVFSVDNAEGLITSNFLSSGPIGAAVRFGNDRIHLFDMTGTKFIKFNYDSDAANLESRTDQPIGSFEEDGEGAVKFFESSTYYASTLNPLSPFPYANDGIDAAVQYEIDPSVQRYFSNDGQNSAILEYKNLVANVFFWDWSSSLALENIFGSNFIFTTVGAATRVKYGSTTQEFIYFNEQGDQMLIQTDPTTFKGPYFIN